MTGTPGAGGPITPGAMSLATGTPYGTTPGGTTAAAMNTPYTPSGQTPFMTPYHTPGHSAATPRQLASGGVRIPPYGHPPGSRGGSGTNTPRGVGGLTPGRQPPLPPSRQAKPPPPAGGGGGYTPGGTPSGRTPRSSSGMRPAPYPSPSGYAAAGHRSHQSPAGGGGRPQGGTSREAEGWAAAADAWARGGRSNRSTPREGGGATPRGYGGGVTPRMEEGSRQSGSRTPKGSGSRRTPKVNGSDATPLYDEN